MMDLETRQVIDDWDREVSAEMRKLIREGMPPFDAGREAPRRVSRRRRIDAMISQAQEARVSKELDDPIFTGPNDTKLTCRRSVRSTRREPLPRKR